ncbi:MAG: SPOR domain-containing protein [Bacteroidales bacterium]|jgi:hypothetical protein|nr:SPOR domain-containing protein [Bacteroidales bacterium]
MTRKALILVILFSASAACCMAQGFIRTTELMKRSDESNAGRLTIVQDRGIDSLISRSIMANSKLRTMEGTPGIQGYRIQIYYSSVRNAREESARTRAEFINKFPDVVSYVQYQEPGYFMVRVGDYRTKTELYKDLIEIRKVFPNAYHVPAVINYPGQGMQ